LVEQIHGASSRWYAWCGGRDPDRHCDRRRDRLPPDVARGSGLRWTIDHIGPEAARVIKQEVLRALAEEAWIE